MSEPKTKLKGIVLSNFQSHKLTKLRIHPRITTITGENLTGKTAVLRGVDSVLNFSKLRVRTGAKREEEEALVRLIFEDVTVTRRRTEKIEEGKAKLVAQKLVTRQGDDKQEYRKLGQSLPAVVVELLNAGSIKVDKAEVDLTMAMQHDPAFLIAPGTPGSLRLKMLGTVNEQIRFDQGLRQLKTEEKGLKSRLKALDADIHDLEDKLEEERKKPDLSAYQDAATALEMTVEGTEFEIRQKEQMALSLETARQALSVCVRQLEDLPTEQALTATEESLREIAALEASILERDAMLADLRARRAYIRELDEQLTALDGVEAQSVEALEVMEAQIADKWTLWQQISSTEDHLDDLEREVIEVTRSLEFEQGLLEEMTKDGARCPYFEEVELQDPCRKRIREDGFEV